MDIHGNVGADDAIVHADRGCVVSCPPALEWANLEPIFEVKAQRARTLWAWEIKKPHLYMVQQMNDAGVCGLYAALLLPVPVLPNGPGEPGLKGFPVWHGRGCGPHISILYHVMMPREESRQWQVFHEIKLRLGRWLLGETSMLLSDCSAIRLTVARECQLHTQLRLAREEVLGQMHLEEFTYTQAAGSLACPWDDFHVTWIHWGTRWR